MRALTACSLVLLMAATQLGAQERTIDLSASVIALEITVPAGQPVVPTIVNMAPGARYRLTARLERREIEPLPVPTASAAARVALPVACQTLQGATRALLYESLNERDVPNRLDEVTKALAALTPSELQACPDFAREARNAAGRTERTLGPWILDQDQRLIVVVERLDDKNEVQRSWSHTFTTQAAGNWYASYGFVFSEDDDEFYFTTPSGEEGKYLIEEQAPNRDLAFVPMLFYSWEPRRAWPGRGFSIGPAGGLGFDMSNPVVALGLNITYRRNLSFVAGGLVRKVKRLEGKYDKAALPITVGESLSSDQLSQETWAPAVFFGLSFRFGKSPFDASDGSGAGENEKE